MLIPSGIGTIYAGEVEGNRCSIRGCDDDQRPKDTCMARSPLYMQACRHGDAALAGLNHMCGVLKCRHELRHATAWDRRSIAIKGPCS